MTESKQSPITDDAQPAQNAEARLDAMSAWASKTETQIRGLVSGNQVLIKQIEHIAAAQAEIEQRLGQVCQEHVTDSVDPNIGYKPTSEQQSALYAALASWQGASKSLGKQSKAQIQTRSGGTVEYKYADIASVSEIAKTAGNSGLAHFHRQVNQDGRVYMRTYLVHQNGGWIFADVPLLTRESTMISSLQQWASACTMARRYGLFMVLGIAAGDEDDDGAMSDSRSARQNAANHRPPMGTLPSAPTRKAP